jgi:hypothetical protein
MAARRHQRFQAHIFYTGLFPPELSMPSDAVPLSEYSKGEKNSLTVDILAFSARAFDNPYLASTATFRGSKYSIGQYIVLEADNWYRLYLVGKIMQCVVHPSLGGEKFKFVLRQYDCARSADIEGKERTMCESNWRPSRLLSSVGVERKKINDCFAPFYFLLSS